MDLYYVETKKTKDHDWREYSNTLYADTAYKAVNRIASEEDYYAARVRHNGETLYTSEPGY